MIPSTRVPDASQITAVLARLQPDSALQQYTEMHKNDPYIVSLAIAESNRRKQARLGQQAATPVASKPVVPQEIEAISQPSALPEDVGIGALPAPNLSQIATGANGGIVAFADEGAVKAAPDYESMIREEAARQGMDPDLAVRLFKTESALNPEAVSKKGAVGLGQLMPGAAKDMGLTPEERKDPKKNIQASVGYYMRQLKQFGDPEKAAAAYNWGPGNVKEHLAKNQGELNKVGLPEETAKYLTKLLPVGTAQAAPAQKSGIATVAPQQEDDTVYDPMTGIPMYGSQTRGPELNTTIRESLGLGNPENRKIIEEAEAARNKKPEPVPYIEAANSQVDPDKVTKQAPPSPATIIEAAKSTMTPEQQKKSGFQPEDWLRLGFSLMSGKSPYALQNLGSAGIATLEGIKDREKMAQDAASKNAQSKLYEAQARALNLAEKYDLTKQKLVLDAIKDAHAAVEKWESGLGGIQSLNDKTARDRKFKEELDLRMQAIKMAYPDINIPTTMPQAEKTSNWKLVGVEKQ